MKMSRSLVLAIAGSVMIATAATAADSVVSTQSHLAELEQREAPTFNWSRAYGGVYAGSWMNCCGFMAGLYAGKNLQMGDSIIVGVEGMTGTYFDNGLFKWESYLLTRLGVLLGGNVLTYGAVGIEWNGPRTSIVMAAAVGVEIGMSHARSFRVQLLVYDVLGDRTVALHGGIAWHRR